MRLLKYCKRAHNIALGCNTFQLGTFDYYRELDSSFAIADAREGYIHYLGPETEIVVDADELNGVTGGAVRATDRTNIGAPPPFRNPGATNVQISGATFEYGADGILHARVGPTLDVKLHYPNSYIFCMSIVGDQEPPDPQKISSDYDSYYRIGRKNL
jgi:hypothetical protein